MGTLKITILNHIPCAVFCDLSKAFDCLSHPILLDKLEYYGIRGIPLQLIKSYLQNRTQFVQINSTMSTTTSINIGIPQGSVLGPLFFNICINDIKNCTNKFDIVSYADDTTLISTIGSFHVRSPKKMKFETAPPQILIKLYTLPLYDYNRRPVIY